MGKMIKTKKQLGSVAKKLKGIIPFMGQSEDEEEECEACGS